MTTSEGPNNAPLNTIAVGGRPFLLALCGYGSNVVHLVARSAQDSAIAIFEPDDEDRGGSLNPAYDKGQLRERCWTPRTLCGREGWWMAPTDAGGASVGIWEGDGYYAPSCKRCLRALDKEFTAPVPDEALEANVDRCILELTLWASLLVDGIPVQQVELLRARVRAECRKRGWKIQTSAFDDRLLAMSENSLAPERREFVAADTRMRLRGRMPGEPAFDMPSWHFAWLETDDGAGYR